MNLLALDCETSAKPLHDPFNPDAKLMYVGLYDGVHYADYPIEYRDTPYGEMLGGIQKPINQADLLIGANIKFDLHWLRRYGIRFDGKKVWDVLLVQFILNHQTTPFTSLNDVLAHWGLPLKLDIVKTEYWDKGLQTDQVPEPILQEYLKGDIVPLMKVYELQRAEVMRRGILPLITIHNQDLLMLQEMEWNGNLYDVDGSITAGQEKQQEADKLIEELNNLAGVVPKHWSPDFISLLLYGGTYKYIVKEPYTFTYKDGSTKEKTHNVEKAVDLPRLCTPPKKARAKEGFWPTDEATLKKLKTVGKATKIVKNLLRFREIEKLRGTYLEGFPSKIQEAGWENNTIHTNYNQGVAVTGRLTSDKPNCQNVPPEQKEFFTSRFKEI